jgi:hypothetical protein
MPLICPTAKAEYFCEGGLDWANQLEIAGDFFLGRHRAAKEPMPKNRHQIATISPTSRLQIP